MSASQRFASIIVVEDDDSTRDSLQVLLKALGYQSQSFTTAECLESQLPLECRRCCLVDINLPGKSGLELCRRLSAEGHIVILMTALVDDETRLEATKSGASACLEKTDLAVRLAPLLQALQSDDAS